MSWGFVVVGKDPKAQAIKAKITKWDCVKLKGICTSKKTAGKPLENLENGRKYTEL